MQKADERSYGKAIETLAMALRELVAAPVNKRELPMALRRSFTRHALETLERALSQQPCESFKLEDLERLRDDVAPLL